MRLTVFIKPNSKQAPKIVKNDDFWTVFVKSPPVDSKANIEAGELLAKELNIPKSKVKLTKGHKSRYKIFEIE